MRSLWIRIVISWTWICQYLSADESERLRQWNGANLSDNSWQSAHIHHGSIKNYLITWCYLITNISCNINNKTEEKKPQIFNSKTQIAFKETKKKNNYRWWVFACSILNLSHISVATDNLSRQIGNPKNYSCFISVVHKSKRITSISAVIPSTVEHRSSLKQHTFHFDDIFNKSLHIQQKHSHREWSCDLLDLVSVFFSISSEAVTNFLMPSTTLSGMAQYEMLVSHSPPVFSHSPPASFLADYGPNVNRYVFASHRSFARSVSSINQSHFQERTLKL